MVFAVIHLGLRSAITFFCGLAMATNMSKEVFVRWWLGIVLSFSFLLLSFFQFIGCVVKE